MLEDTVRKKASSQKKLNANNVDDENNAAAAINEAHEANEDAKEAQDVQEEAIEADVNDEAMKAQEGFNSPCFEEHVQTKLGPRTSLNLFRKI